MTETEWLASDDPGLLLAWLVSTRDVSGRKVRLFLVASCRSIWDWMPSDGCRAAVLVGERYADGQASAEDVRAAGEVAESAVVGYESWLGDKEIELNRVSYGPPPGTEAEVEAAAEAVDQAVRAYGAAALARSAVSSDTSRSALRALYRAWAWVGPVWADSLRCIFAVPGRPRPSPPAAWFAWKDGLIPSLTRAAYEERDLPRGHLDPVRLAVLADALEEAGCADADVLGHLRGPGPHVRGCWALDLLLGRE